MERVLKPLTPHTIFQKNRTLNYAKSDDKIGKQATYSQCASLFPNQAHTEDMEQSLKRIEN